MFIIISSKPQSTIIIWRLKSAEKLKFSATNYFKSQNDTLCQKKAKFALREYEAYSYK